jgi:hypothetical protein
LTIDQLWQGTRDEMQRNAEEKVRIKKDLEDSMNQLRAENKQYQKQIEALQDELDELTSKLIDSGGNGGSPNQPMVSGETIITNILDVLVPNIANKYYGFSTELSFLQMVPIFQKELYLSMLENRSIIDIENYSNGIIILTHISGGRFVFRILRHIEDEDERERNLDIVRDLEHELRRDYKLTDDRFCKVRSVKFTYLFCKKHFRSWFVFGTEIIEDAS